MTHAITFSADGTVVTTPWLKDVNDYVFSRNVTVFNVKDPTYGAVGDGVTNDTAAIQAAITAGAGKTVYFPAGTYLVTSTLTVTAFTTLLGEESGFGLQTFINTPTDIITLTTSGSAPVYGITVKNINFRNTMAVVAGAGMTVVQAKFVGCALTTIDNCRFTSALLDADYNVNNAGGIWFTAAASCFLNRITNCGVQGRVLIDCTDSIISDSFVYGHNGSYGIKFTGGNNSAVNLYDLNGSRLHGAIWLNNVTSCRVEGCFFDILGLGIYADNGSSNVITGNTFEGVAACAIYLEDTTSYVVSNNTFHNCGSNDTGNTEAEIQIKGVLFNPEMNVISNNSFFRTATRSNTSYAIMEINGGFTPLLNSYRGNSFIDSVAQYRTPAILRLTTYGTTASKLSDNVGKGTDTEVAATYTPTWTSSGTAPAIGNGLLLGQYVRSGDMVTVSILMAAGSTTTFGTGTWSFALPFAVGTRDFVGHIEGVDSGVTLRCGICRAVAGASVIAVLTHDNNAGTSWGQLVPFTWGTGDNLYITLTYSVA